MTTQCLNFTIPFFLRAEEHFVSISTKFSIAKGITNFEQRPIPIPPQTPPINAPQKPMGNIIEPVIVNPNPIAIYAPRWPRFFEVSLSFITLFYNIYLTPIARITC